VYRLQSLDAVCRNDVEMDVEYVMSLPNISTYCDVHGGKGVPELKLEHIFEYFLESEKSFTEKYINCTSKGTFDIILCSET
jgi:hypothetical protein